MRPLAHTCVGLPSHAPACMGASRGLPAGRGRQSMAACVSPPSLAWVNQGCCAPNLRQSASHSDADTCASNGIGTCWLAHEAPVSLARSARTHQWQRRCWQPWIRVTALSGCGGSGVRSLPRRCAGQGSREAGARLSCALVDRLGIGSKAMQSGSDQSRQAASRQMT